MFLADAVDQISDILFVCEVYARRYLVKTTEYDGASALGNEVLIQIPPLYAVILKFSYHMRTLVNHGKFGKMASLLPYVDFSFVFLKRLLSRLQSDSSQLRT